MSTKTSENEQADNEIFSKVGFDPALRDAFNRICVFIRSEDGCNAGVYRPPKMKQMRAAHFLPDNEGRKKAKQVFLKAEARGHKMVLERRYRKREERPKEEWQREVGADFSEWAGLEAKLKEWSLDVKGPIKPKATLE
jgi:hypothetical protein